MHRPSISDTNEYRKLIESIDLSGISLINLSQRCEVELSPPFRVEHTFAVPQDGIDLNKLTAEAHFGLKAIPSDSDEEHPHISIEMVWLARYEFKANEECEYTTETLNEFFQRNVPINIWPYIRETVLTYAGSTELFSSKRLPSTC